MIPRDRLPRVSCARLRPSGGQGIRRNKRPAGRLLFTQFHAVKLNRKTVADWALSCTKRAQEVSTTTLDRLGARAKDLRHSFGERHLDMRRDRFETDDAHELPY